MNEEETTLTDFETESESKTVDLNPIKVQIPTSWGFRPINSLSDLVTDGAHQTPEYVDEGVRFLSTKNLKPGSDEFDYSEYEKFITEEKHSKLCDRVAPQYGDVLISKSGTIGITQLVREDLDFNIFVGLGLVRPTEDLNGVYLEQLLNWRQMQKAMRARSPGSTRSTLPIFAIKELELPFPPLSEQRKIATVLHTVDQAIQKTEEIVEQATLVRDGLRQTVFSVGINSRGQPRELSDEELQKTRIGEIPSIWDFSRLDEVCSDVVDCLNTTPEYSDDGIRVVLTSEIEDGRYNPDESPYVTEEVYRERIRRIEPRAGDVIFTREAPIGEAFKIPEGERLCLGQRTMQLRVKNGVLDSDYLLEALYSEKMQGWYQRVAVGSTTKHVRVEDVEGMKIPVPEIDEQRKIASLLGSYRSYIEASLHYTDKLRNLKQGLMQDLLSGKVRTTDANIEIPEEVAKYG